MSEGDRLRTVIISDPHCGHRSGLTPPDWQYPVANDPIISKYAEVQRVMWGWYFNTIQALQPIDRLILNGDAIDGKGQLSGGTELLVADRHVQVNMAAIVVGVAQAKRVAIIKGTGYHVGKDEDWEEVLAGKVNADRCGFHEWFDSNGYIIDVKHRVGGSSIPHGRYTALGRAQLWNLLWSERKMQPRANVLVRSHVHYHVGCFGPDWMACTTPALQGWTKFGSREVEGTNDIGLTVIDTWPGRIEWHFPMLDMVFMAAKVVPV